MLWSAASHGYPYELIGLCYYVMFLFMGRKKSAARFSARSRILTLIAAMAMVGAVPFGYGTNGIAAIAMFALAAVALGSSMYDVRA